MIYDYWWVNQFHLVNYDNQHILIWQFSLCHLFFCLMWHVELCSHGSTPSLIFKIQLAERLLIKIPLHLVQLKLKYKLIQVMQHGLFQSQTHISIVHFYLTAFTLFKNFCQQTMNAIYLVGKLIREVSKAKGLIAKRAKWLKYNTFYKYFMQSAFKSKIKFKNILPAYFFSYA